MAEAICDSPPVRVLSNGSGPPAGFVMRPVSVYREWIIQYPHFPVQYHENCEDEGKVWLWIPREDNVAYEKGEGYRQTHIVHERRWCNSRIKVTCMKRGSKAWFSEKLVSTVVSSIHSVMQSYPSRKITYSRLRRGNESGILVRRTQ